MDEIDAAIAAPSAADGEPTPAQQFIHRLAMSVPEADDAFAQRLERDLVSVLERRSDEATRSRPAGWLRVPRVRYGIAALVLGVSLVVAGTVVAQKGPGRLITLREVTVVPPVGEIAPYPKPTGRRWMELDELSRRLGAPLSLPAALPEGCTERERYYHEGLQMASVVYSCVVAQLHGGTGDFPLQVAGGSSQHVTVSGQPAVYIDGAWTSIGGSSSAPAWTEGFQTLVFERDGLVIRLMTFPGDVLVHNHGGEATLIRNTWSLGRDDLLRIAESFAPVP